ncbi:MAG TPA: hypothetical protein QF800_03650 [Phycisphaerales bacterium]|nr:hypothetical protein [Phycisphaerales bacterium]
MADKEDRKRLAEVHTTDLTESNVNEDFVTWLKTKGPTWLLIVLAFIVAYLAMVRWQEADARGRDEAWLELATTVHPASLEDVARRHVGIDGVSDLARLIAADTLLTEIRTGRTLDATGQEWETLTPDTRAAHIATARRIYQSVLNDDDASAGRTLATVAALNGLAALDETQGNIDDARSRYDQIATRAQQWLPPLAKQAQIRAASLDQMAQPVQLATPPAIPQAASTVPELLSTPPGFVLPTKPDQPTVVPQATKPDQPTAPPVPPVPPVPPAPPATPKSP